MRNLRSVIATILVLALIGAGCGGENPTKHQGTSSAFYANSFELPTDTLGWTGLHPEMFVDGAAPGCGERALQIGGGCLQPAAALTFSAVRCDKYYAVSLWGKIDQSRQMGSVMLTIPGDEGMFGPSIAIRVDNVNWTHYRSSELLHVPAGVDMSLMLFIGGFVPSGMMIDNLQIEMVIPADETSRCD
ncbi:MAG: hypothetical protein KOO62_08590 [candidate division Zixibacteria bacterium]|nr:hypothetical protein [candidate division Zixibacteria bacterium]